jgi:hypothetical protein
MIENGFVHLPSAASWLAQYLHELTTFPNGRHDDQVDSTAQLLDWFKRGSGPSSNAGIFELYRQRAEELRRGQAGPLGAAARPGRRRGGSALVRGPPQRKRRRHGRDPRVGRRPAAARGVDEGRGALSFYTAAALHWCGSGLQETYQGLICVLGSGPGFWR